jgi:phage terminase small subunit
MAAKPEPVPGSQPLKNVRWEAFAQGLVRGELQHVALAQAGILLGGSVNTRKTHARDLLRDQPSIRERVTWLKQQSAQMAMVVTSDVVHELARIGFSDIRRVVQWDDEGNVTVRASESLSADEAASIKRFKVSERKTKEGDTLRTVEVELWDKHAALAMLGKYTGGFDEATRPQPPVETEFVAGEEDEHEGERLLMQARHIEATTRKVTNDAGDE